MLMIRCAHQPESSSREATITTAPAAGMHFCTSCVLHVSAVQQLAQQHQSAMAKQQGRTVTESGTAVADYDSCCCL